MLQFSQPVDGGDRSVRVAFTTREAGNLALHVGDDPAAVAARRDRLVPDLGLPGPAQFMDQIHSSLVAHVEGPVSPAPTADALVTTADDLPLAVMVADCLPVVVSAVAGGRVALAAAHAGRRGLLDGVLRETVSALRAAVPADGGAEPVITAWIGPSICGRCYEVPATMRAEAEQQLPGTGSTTRWGSDGLDLPAGAARQLRGLGADVVESGACTLEDERFYSYREDPGTGRIAGIIWLGAGGGAETRREKA
ncbi:polyphenol oxidase family protein [Zhihengliuella salsuginis]|uniref:Laccase domain protein n=1 Tax=Zhihengliuella salsuginis TaxID=578222 RepID=A0ABQ3GC64_9MICC|nr:polyphenol oxidase family protein [Zhihengliuella salsuginis]GHD00976.1 laccase domain protein [Zhihengliuella salsuginis]